MIDSTIIRIVLGALVLGWFLWRARRKGPEKWL